MSSVPRLALLLLPFALACATDDAPTAPSPEPGVPAGAFRLTIDVATGQVTVARAVGPAGAARASASRAGAASASLVGAEALTLHATSCEWGAAASTKQKRCTFDLAIENRLPSVALATPTSFPTPPAGTSGILVFPFASAALTPGGGGAAVPTTDWDGAPISFFNDPACGAKGANDCYRYEPFAAPLLPGETTVAQRVGFDVDRTAQSVAVYLVVAADLRPVEQGELTLLATPELCGTASIVDNTVGADVLSAAPGTLFAGNSGDALTTLRFRGLCSFALPSALEGAEILAASLQVRQDAVSGLPFTGYSIVVDHMDFGTELTASGFDLAALASSFGVLSTDAALGARSLDVTAQVQADVDAGRVRSQYRIRRTADDILGPAGFATFTGTGDPHGPRLVVSYRRYF